MSVTFRKAPTRLRRRGHQRDRPHQPGGRGDLRRTARGHGRVRRARLPRPGVHEPAAACLRPPPRRRAEPQPGAEQGAAERRRAGRHLQPRRQRRAARHLQQAPHVQPGQPALAHGRCVQRPARPLLDAATRASCQSRAARRSSSTCAPPTTRCRSARRRRSRASRRTFPSCTRARPWGSRTSRRRRR